MLRMKGFYPIWFKWIKSFFQVVTLETEVKDQLGPYFQTKKSLR